ncbi:MAG: hypothetical protein [Caudoviricetes sp.]|nr:MAG: hypothetical protein [Caudoviricetes sp.]
MKTVKITDGKFAGKTVEGTFDLVRMFTYWNNAKQREEMGKNGKVTIIIEGKEKGIWVNAEDCEYSEDVLPVATIVTDDEIKARIRKRFEVMDKMGRGVISGVIRSLIISGAPGIGKTFGLEKQLNKAQSQGRIEVDMVKGRISAIGLYVKLYENREAGCVTVLDDIDVFSDENTINLLKAALDTGEQRWLSWETAAEWLKEKDIPNHFEYEGSIVFITNMNIDKELEKSGKIVPHLDALISRSIYLDLGVHTNRDIMIRVEDVIATTTMLEERGITAFQQTELVFWMKENVDRLRNVSLRTALFIADFIKTDADWKDIAEVTLIKPNNRF